MAVFCSLNTTELSHICVHWAGCSRWTYKAGKMLQLHDHGPGRAGLDAEFAGDALIRIEYDLHRLLVGVESPCGTYRNAGTTMGAFIFVSGDVLAERLDLHAYGGQVLYPTGVVFLRPLQLEDHQALFLRRDLGLQDIEGEIMILDQFIDYRLVDQLMRKCEHYSLGYHGDLLLY